MDNMDLYNAMVRVWGLESLDHGQSSRKSAMVDLPKFWLPTWKNEITVPWPFLAIVNLKVNTQPANTRQIIQTLFSTCI